MKKSTAFLLSSLMVFWILYLATFIMILVQDTISYDLSTYIYCTFICACLSLLITSTSFGMYVLVIALVLKIESKLQKNKGEY